MQAPIPSGIPLDPGYGGDLRLVDSGTDRVSQLDGATSRTSGSQSSATSLAPAAGNTDSSVGAMPGQVDRRIAPPRPGGRRARTEHTGKAAETGRLPALLVAPAAPARPGGLLARRLRRPARPHH